MENPNVKLQEKHNNRIPYRQPNQLSNACECGKSEAVALLKGKQKLCEACLYEWGELVLL